VIINDGGMVPVPMPMPVGIPEKGVVMQGGFGAISVDDGVRELAPNDVVAPDQQPFGVRRDTLWTKSVAVWLGLSVIFLLLSVQAVSPTRRWRLRRGAAPRSPAP
jgi:hypothetical protein